MLSTPNFYCCNFNGRAVPWVSRPFELDVTKTENEEWGMGNGEWGMGNGEWGMGNGE